METVTGQDGTIHYIKHKITQKFATTTTGEIIKMSNGEILNPEEEPLFLLRARDRLALPTLDVDYRRRSIEDGCNDFHMGLLDNDVKAFKLFKWKFPERMKQPSITRGK